MAFQKEETLQKVTGIIADKLSMQKDNIQPAATFKDLGADSLDQVELVMELEEEFDINIPDDAADKIQTVGQAIEHIARAVEEKSETSS